MTSKPGKQTIAIHILHNISRSKENWTMKCGLIIEYMRIMVEKVFPDPFLKNQNWTYFWINSLKF